MEQLILGVPSLWAELSQEQPEIQSPRKTDLEIDDITAMRDRSQWTGIIKIIPGTPFLVSQMDKNLQLLSEIVSRY